MLEESYEGKAGDCGLFFIIDTCLSEKEIEALKEILIETVKKLPQDIYVGLMLFNQNLLLANFEGY